MSSWSRRVKICGLKSSIEVQQPTVSGNLKKMLHSCLCTSFVSCYCFLTEKIDKNGSVVTIDHFSRLQVGSLLISYGDPNVWPGGLLQATVFLYPRFNEVKMGVYWFHLVHLSVRLHGYEELSTDTNYPIWRRQKLPYMKKTRKKKQVCGAACFMAAEIKFSEDVRPSVRLWTESCLLCIFNYTHQIHFIFAHLIKQLQKV